MRFVWSWRRAGTCCCGEAKREKTTLIEEGKSAANARTKLMKISWLEFYDMESWLCAIADLCFEIYFINFIDSLFPMTAISLNRQQQKKKEISQPMPRLQASLSLLPLFHQKTIKTFRWKEKHKFFYRKNRKRVESDGNKYHTQNIIFLWGRMAQRFS